VNPNARPRRLLTAIVNHGLAADALRLRDAFAGCGPALAIDSGSDLSAEQRAAFDRCLPNVYYTGLLQVVLEHCADWADEDVLFFVCSDVGFENVAATHHLALEAFQEPRVGIWGPAATGAFFSTIANFGTQRMRDVAVVEGFCIAARLGLFRALFPMAIELNRYGCGLDLQMAYFARAQRLRVVIDDRAQVHHAIGKGYSLREAKLQQARWEEQLSAPAQRAHRLYSDRWIMQRRLGCWLLGALPAGFWSWAFRAGLRDA
jgi:hypothetical protein